MNDMAEKFDVPIKFNVPGRMWARIESVLKEHDYTQSEYMRELIRRDLERRDMESVSRALARCDSTELEQMRNRG